jgi:hypothetical protein
MEMTRTRKARTREDLKEATWITVLGNKGGVEFRGNSEDVYTADWEGCYVFPADWLCEEAKESLRNSETIPCSPMPGHGMKELIHFAIDNGFFDDDLADGTYEEFKGEVEEEEAVW